MTATDTQVGILIREHQKGKTQEQADASARLRSTLSAAYKISQGSGVTSGGVPSERKLHLLPDLIVLVARLSKCKGAVTEIAQF